MCGLKITSSKQIIFYKRIVTLCELLCMFVLHFRKLYVFISIAFCLLLCCLILFFVFPRSVTINPVSVLSVMVYFNPQRVDMEVTVSDRRARKPVT